MSAYPHPVIAQIYGVMLEADALVAPQGEQHTALMATIAAEARERIANFLTHWGPGRAAREGGCHRGDVAGNRFRHRA